MHFRRSTEAVAYGVQEMLLSTFPGFSEEDVQRELGEASCHDQLQHNLGGLWRSSGGNGQILSASWIVPTSSESCTPPVRCMMTGSIDCSGRESYGPLRSHREGTEIALSSNHKPLDMIVPDGETQEGGCKLASITGSGISPCQGRNKYTTCRKIAQGDVVAVERPLAAVQTSEALPWVVACPGCLRHVGSLDLQLSIASGQWDRANALNFPQQQQREQLSVPEGSQSRGSGGSGTDPFRTGGIATEMGDQSSRESPTLEGLSLPPIPGLTERFSEVRRWAMIVDVDVNGSSLTCSRL